MNVLDENIPNSQRHILRNWRIRVQQIGHEIGRRGMKDEEIIPLLHKIARQHSLPEILVFTVQIFATLTTVWSACLWVNMKLPVLYVVFFDIRRLKRGPKEWVKLFG